MILQWLQVKKEKILPVIDFIGCALKYENVKIVSLTEFLNKAKIQIGGKLIIELEENQTRPSKVQFWSSKYIR